MEYIFLYDTYSNGSCGSYDLYWAESPMCAVKKFLAHRGIEDKIILKGLTAFQDEPIEDIIEYVNKFVDENDAIYRILNISSVE